MTDRRRSTSGRPSNAGPRNTRPRDELGRPLAYDAVGFERIPDDLVLPPLDALSEAQRLLDAGLPFHAHEVLEGTWRQAPPAERDLWQGLAQLAVGLTHLLRGNSKGAARLLRRGAVRVEKYAENPPYGIDAAGLVRWAGHLAERIETGLPDAADVTSPRLRSVP